MKKLMRMVFDSNAIVEMMKKEIAEESGIEVAESVDFDNKENIIKLSDVFRQGMIEASMKEKANCAIFVKQSYKSVGDLEIIWVADKPDFNGKEDKEGSFEKMMELLDVITVSKEGTNQYQKDYNEAVASFDRIK